MKCETLFSCNEWAACIVFERFYDGLRRFIFSYNDKRKKQSLISHILIYHIMYQTINTYKNISPTCVLRPLDTLEKTMKCILS